MYYKVKVHVAHPSRLSAPDISFVELGFSSAVDDESWIAALLGTRTAVTLEGTSATPHKHATSVKYNIRRVMPLAIAIAGFMVLRNQATC